MKRLKSNELHTYNQKIGYWVNWDRTCDQFLAGNPESEVEGIAVSWMPTFKNLEQAKEMNCNLFVTHEPLYAFEIDETGQIVSTTPSRSLQLKKRHGLLRPSDPWVKKKKWLEKTGMVVYRCHDFWDDYPEVGIHGAWAKWLGFNDKPLTKKKWYEVHSTGDTTLGELAKNILKKIKSLGQEAVQIVNDENTKVSKIALGTGAITNYRQMFDMGADVLLLTDDGTRLWESGQWAMDTGVPLIIVNHSTAEEPGMITLSKYIRDAFPNIPVKHIPVGCIYNTII